MGGSYSGGQGGSGLIYIPEMVDGTLIFRLSNAPGNELIEIGDLHEEIHIGEDEPDDKRKVWLDPSELSVNNVNSLDLVYNAYILAGGSLSKASFIKAFKNIS